ncbi:MAG: hypothetical protein WD626_04660, partial [Bauldia sp.]
PVAIDLARLWAENPSLKEQAVSLMMRLDPRGEAMPPERQIALGLGAELARLRATRRLMVEDQLRLFKKTREEAEALFEERFASVKRLVGEVLA